MIFEILAVILGILVILLFLDQMRPDGYPPGPLPLPLIGHMHLLGDLPQSTLTDWIKKYGPIFACDFGSFKGVVLSDYKLIKEAFNHPAFSGRPQIRAFSERSGGTTKGIIFTDGPQWVEQRRFALRHLRDFGFGKKSQESLIHDEVVEMIEKLKVEAIKEGPISTQNRFNTAILNALWTMVAGVRHSQDDPRLQEIFKLTTETMSDPSPAALFMPWLTKLAPELSGWNHFMSDIAPTLNFLQTFVDEHKQSYNANEEPRDFIDVYLEEIFKTTNPESSFYQKTGETSLSVVLLDFVFASQETTSHTLAWATLYLATEVNRHIQAELQNEMDEAVGRSRCPTLADRPNLPLLEATILETMRCSSIIPLGVWHSTMEDVQFHGFNIPKDTMIVSNLYAVHHNPLVWEDPHSFKPARFLNSTKTEIVKPEEFIPFSIGRRICIGESLARDELFLMLGAIIQNFAIETCPGEPEPSLEPVPGPVSAPKPHKLIFRARK